MNVEELLVGHGIRTAIIMQAQKEQLLCAVCVGKPAPGVHV